ncbi:hypothetical protein FOA52_013729 [Chlamydomonas sp. UWO 241]|nr:hypothetical protein FOA52_013729 [Chlamydomonas sp. UWO 241]
MDNQHRHTPTSAMTAPTQSPVSGRSPSTAQPQPYDMTMNTPPYTAYLRGRGWGGLGFRA